MPRFSLGSTARGAAANACSAAASYAPRLSSASASALRQRHDPSASRRPVRGRGSRAARRGCSRRAGRRRWPHSRAPRPSGGDRPAHVPTQLLGPVPGLGEVAPGGHVAQGDDHRDGVIDEREPTRQVPRGPQVGHFPSQGSVGVRLARGSLRRVDPGHELDRPPHHAVGRDGILTGRGQPVHPERADRLEHAVAGPTLERGVHHRRVDEPGQRASRITGESELGGNVLGRGQVDTVGEDRELAEQLLLLEVRRS